MKKRMLIQYLCAKLDEQIATQLDALLHHPRFQSLESIWRALHDLVMSHNLERTQLKFKLLNLSYDELLQDLSLELNSHLQLLIYSHEFDQAGGEAFGLLVVNFQIAYSEIHLWKSLANIATQSFCTCLIPAGPEDNEISVNDLLNWHSFKQSFPAGFLGVFLGRSLVREPYLLNKRHAIVYQESRECLLFKYNIWLYAKVLIRSFIRQSWFYDVAKALEFPLISSNQGVSERIYYPTKLQRSIQENSLYLVENPFLKQVHFSSHQTLYSHSSEAGITDLASALCLGRIAHYLKILLRNKLSLLGRQQCESYLQNWLQSYCSVSDATADELNYKYPLESARITITEPTPANLKCLVELRLKSLLTKNNSTIQFQTELKL